MRRLVASINRYLGEPDSTGEADGVDEVGPLQMESARPSGAVWLWSQLRDRYRSRVGARWAAVPQGHYFGRKIARTGAAGLLEIFGDAQSQANPGGNPGATEAGDDLSGR